MNKTGMFIGAEIEYNAFAINKLHMILMLFTDEEMQNTVLGLFILFYGS